MQPAQRHLPALGQTPLLQAGSLGLLRRRPQALAHEKRATRAAAAAAPANNHPARFAAPRPNAQPELTKALEKFPKDDRLHFDLALCWEKLGKVSKAMQEYQKIGGSIVSAELNC